MKSKIKSFEEFASLRNKLKTEAEIEGHGLMEIRVAMATCGIASGAGDILNFFSAELPKRSIEARVIPVGCMGYCYAEPTVEIRVPGKEPIVFGFVDQKRADEIIEDYIRNNRLPGGVIPVNYELP